MTIGGSRPRRWPSSINSSKRSPRASPRWSVNPKPLNVGLPASIAGLPPSGAWRPGDPAGGRRFTSIATDRPFALEGGDLLRDITLAYEALEVAADPGQRLLVYTAEPGSPDREALDLLASWTAPDRPSAETEGEPSKS